MPDSDDPSDATDTTVTRRTVAQASAAAALGSVGLVSAASRVQAAPSGTLPDPAAAPLKRVRADRVRHVPRTSDPSNPPNGLVWVRGDL